MRFRIAGSARPASISLLSFSIISLGVFLGAPDPYPPFHYEARQEFAHGWQLWHRIEARRRCNSQRPQLTRVDISNRSTNGVKEKLEPVR